MLNCTPSPELATARTSRPQGVARQLKALSDPTRLQIFDLLMEGTHCNCEIAHELGLSLNLISHHLRVLRQVGLVEGTRDPADERWIYYSVNRAALQALAAAVQRLLDVGRIRERIPQCGPRGSGGCEPKPKEVDY